LLVLAQDQDVQGGGFEAAQSAQADICEVGYRRRGGAFTGLLRPRLTTKRVTVA
jgi:hypothetical protein